MSHPDIKTESPLLTVEQLAFERDDRSLFQPFDWQAWAGEIWQLTGINGAGKTSLLKLLAGLLGGHQGQIRWQLGDEPRQAIGYIGHALGLREELTAAENLAWLAALHGEMEGQDSRRVQQVMKSLGLEGDVDVPLAQLSAGQKRRVAMARLWLSDKRVWLLDEPFTAIDAVGVALLEAHLAELADAGKLIIFTSHHPVNFPTQRVELVRGQVRVVA